MSLAAPALAPGTLPADTDTRQTLVDALGAVSGLTATRAAPDTPTAGATWPVWALNTYGGRLGAPAVRTYDVFVVLPAGYLPDTVDQGDGLVDQVAAALWEVATIQTAEPVQIQFDDSTAMPGLRVRVVVPG